MNNSPLFIVLILIWLAGCTTHKPQIEKQLALFKEGDSVSTLESQLSLSEKPSIYIPNLPIEHSHTIYLLEGGDLHVMTRITDDRRVILSSAPFFIPTTTSIKQRMENSNQAWATYVRAKTGKKD